MGSGRIEPGRFRVGSDRTAAGPNSLSYFKAKKIYTSQK